MNEETGSERELLEAHLDEARATAVRKVRGLTLEQATQRLGPSQTSAGGVLKHLVNVERWWFRHCLAGEADVPFDLMNDGRDFGFDLSPDDTVDSLIADYELACADSRRIAALFDLTDQLTADVQGPRSSLRWVYLHMIDEVARHNGHLDIYRELLTGETD